MFGKVFVVREDIVEVCRSVLALMRTEDMVDESLKTRRSVRKPERHDVHLEETHGCSKRGFPLVTGADANEVIGHLQIKFGVDLRSLDRVEEFVDKGERISILECDRVETAKVVTETKGAVLLLSE